MNKQVQHIDVDVDVDVDAVGKHSACRPWLGASEFMATGVTGCRIDDVIDTEGSSGVVIR